MQDQPQPIAPAVDRSAVGKHPSGQALDGLLGGTRGQRATTVEQATTATMPRLPARTASGAHADLPGSSSSSSETASISER
jgi:hypothetical protein